MQRSKVVEILACAGTIISSIVSFEISERKTEKYKLYDRALEHLTESIYKTGYNHRFRSAKRFIHSTNNQTQKKKTVHFNNRINKHKVIINSNFSGDEHAPREKKT